MCAGCEQAVYASTLQYMAETGVHLEIALRLTRDVVVQNAIADQHDEMKSDEVVLATIRDLCSTLDTVADRMRAMNPAAIQALVAMLDRST